MTSPCRFTSSKKVGPWVGRAPSRNQWGECDVSGGITKAGDVNLRRALCQAATVMMHRGRSTWLSTWAAQVTRRRGSRRAASVSFCIPCRARMQTSVLMVRLRRWFEEPGPQLTPP